MRFGSDKPGKLLGLVPVLGSLALAIGYSVVTGWIFKYTFQSFTGSLSQMQGVAAFDANFGATAGGNVFWQLVGMAVTVVIMAFGIGRGIEKANKVMTPLFYLLFIGLAVYLVTLPGAAEGYRYIFVLKPEGLLDPMVWVFALGQAFFSLSIAGNGTLIYGSYLGRDSDVPADAKMVALFDTLAAMLAALVIIPAMAVAGEQLNNSGPGLIFITLPNIFNAMDGGILWGTLFFVFMSCAALSTVIGVFENIISYSVDVSVMPRRRACAVHFVCLWLASLPCALGFNLLADFQPLGPGTCVLDLEDFLLSNNLLPFGCLLFLLFCSWRRGWGWDNFVAEVNQGQGVRFPRFMKYYLRYGLPCIILLVFVMGYVDKFWK